MSDGASELDHAMHVTRAWLRDVVVGLDLCPYARGPLAGGRVRLAVARGGLEQRLHALVLEAQRLDDTPPKTLETTLLVLPEAPSAFVPFMDETGLAEHVLADALPGGVLQVVAFHPGFRFADAEPDDPGNAVNRSPVPLWHLLREDSVRRVLDADPDAAGAIPVRNRTLLHRLGGLPPVG